MASPRRWCSTACGSLNVIFFSYDFIPPREAGRGDRVARATRWEGRRLHGRPPRRAPSTMLRHSRCFASAFFDSKNGGRRPPMPPPPHSVRGRKNKILLATRCAPEACAPPPRPGLPEGRRSAAKAQPSIGRTTQSDVAIEPCAGAAAALIASRSPFGAPPAALARANASAVGSAPVTALPETRRGGRYPLPPISSLPRSAGTGRGAGRAGTRSRPGAVCETARGHRTRSASRSHPECALQ
jgi:hypothetical protein